MYSSKFYISQVRLFVGIKENNLVFLVIYVDDIIITGNNSADINNIKTKLHNKFFIKDLGSLNYFFRDGGFLFKQWFIPYIENIH